MDERLLRSPTLTETAPIAIMIPVKHRKLSNTNHPPALRAPWRNQMRFLNYCIFTTFLLAACCTARGQHLPRSSMSNPAVGVDEKWEYTPPVENAETGRRNALAQMPPGVSKIAFIKLNSFTSNHYYTEFINHRWMPGTDICILDLKTGRVKSILPEKLGKSGIVARMDVNYELDKIVFDYKDARDNGYRIWEMKVDGTGLRRILPPPSNEAEIVKKYRKGYHHGTDDMHPCYLPDGDICFISTRCQYGVLCDPPDIFSTTVLYRMKPDGSGLRVLSNSAVSEQAPSITPDGRIIYSRWEYVDKGASTVKCIWSMRPDGTASAEVYGNDIALPPTMNYPRAIPGSNNQYVILAGPHYPQGNYGSIVRLDTKKDIRTYAPMTYMTPFVDVRSEGGWHHRDSSESDWQRRTQGRYKRCTEVLLTDPYPLSKKYFLVSQKPKGPMHNDPKGYALYLLDERGKTWLIHRDKEISCFMPYPLIKRKRPDMKMTTIDESMAKKGLAVCIVTNVYHGMEDVKHGQVRFIRVLEQVSRPWSARRFWKERAPEQAHSAVGATHLAVKAQYGVVPVEADGSANFTVPAYKNIFFQALDKNYRAIQTERTYVNYMPGEVRACIGCHERPNESPELSPKLAALKRPPSAPGPQLGEKQGNRPLDFVTDVQPVLDKHCIKCHNEKKEKGRPDFSNKLTDTFNVAYESLVSRGVMPLIREIRPKTGNAHYLPAKAIGSYNSILAMIVTKGELTPPGERPNRIKKDLEAHKDLKLTPVEVLKITNFIDTNAQYYGSYYGRKGLAHKDHPNFRPKPTWDSAIGIQPIPDDKR